MKFYTVAQAAEYLGVSKSTMYTWHRNGKLVPDLVNDLTSIRHYSQEQLDELKEEYKKPEKKIRMSLRNEYD